MKLSKENVPFTQVANVVLNDAELTAKAKGVYAYLFSKPDGWQFSAIRMAMDFRDGKDSLDAALQELEQQGYLVRHREATGQMRYELKFSLSGKTPLREKAQVGNSLSGEIPLLSNTEGLVTKKPLKDFDAPDLESEWQAFQQHRKQMHKPLTAISRERNLAKLRKWPKATAIAALKLAIEMGWQGVFEPRKKQPRQPYRPGPEESREKRREREQRAAHQSTEQDAADRERMNELQRQKVLVLRDEVLKQMKEP